MEGGGAAKEYELGFEFALRFVFEFAFEFERVLALVLDSETVFGMVLETVWVVGFRSSSWYKVIIIQEECAP